VRVGIGCRPQIAQAGHTLPTPDEARDFLAESDPQKRSKLIDRLLAGEEFADHQALKRGDLMRIKCEFPSNLWPNAVQAYHRWIRDSIAENKCLSENRLPSPRLRGEGLGVRGFGIGSKPYDQSATELLTSTGSDFRAPPADYHRAFLTRDPQNLTVVAALVFMGARIGCAGGHGHPPQYVTKSAQRQASSASGSPSSSPPRHCLSKQWHTPVQPTGETGTPARPRKGTSSCD
jgi:hypothetical protein